MASKGALLEALGISLPNDAIPQNRSDRNSVCSYDAVSDSGALGNALGAPGELSRDSENPVFQVEFLFGPKQHDVTVSDLTLEATRQLGRLAAEINANSDISQVSVLGHTDSVGSEAFNQRLSIQRATAVANYLVEKGVDRALMLIAGMGETQPIADNSTPEGRRQNRRVEVHIRTTPIVPQ